MFETKKKKCKACGRVGTAGFRKDGPFMFCSYKAPCDHRRYMAGSLPPEQAAAHSANKMKNGKLLPTKGDVTKEAECRWCRRRGMTGFIHDGTGLARCIATSACIGRTYALRDIPKDIQAEIEKEKAALADEKSSKTNGGICIDKRCSNPSAPGSTLCSKCTESNRKRMETWVRNNPGALEARRQLLSARK